jgi:hypothetical protein
METVKIGNGSDLAQWAIQRAKAIVAEEGGNLALAARDQANEHAGRSSIEKALA